MAWRRSSIYYNHRRFYQEYFHLYFLLQNIFPLERSCFLFESPSFAKSKVTNTGLAVGIKFITDDQDQLANHCTTTRLPFHSSFNTAFYPYFPRPRLSFPFTSWLIFRFLFSSFLCSLFVRLSFRLLSLYLPLHKLILLHFNNFFFFSLKLLS